MVIKGFSHISTYSNIWIWSMSNSSASSTMFNFPKAKAPVICPNPFCFWDTLKLCDLLSISRMTWFFFLVTAISLISFNNSQSFNHHNLHDTCYYLGSIFCFLPKSWWEASCDYLGNVCVHELCDVLQSRHSISWRPKRRRGDMPERGQVGQPMLALWLGRVRRIREKRW